ncbi:MAG: MBL fold metallo-hydrolase [Clostridiaceae bacterium]|nr:MBL fold metallo-hydrolase [Clostridiaceae bacterium]
MFYKSLSFRPYNVGGCFEFKLPNDKTVLIDPYFPEDGKGIGKDKEVVKACDYILLSHTHFDHDMHVGYFVEKFNPKVFTQASAAEAVMIFHDIPIDNIIPVHHGQTFELDGFTVQAFMTKHATFGPRKYDPDHDPTFKRTGIKGHKRVDMYGDIECVNYLITLENGFTTAIVSGTDFSKEIQKLCTQHHIDLLFRQFGIRTEKGIVGDSQIPPEEFADVIARYHAQVSVPFHFENALKKWGEEKMADYLNSVNAALRKKKQCSVIIMPEAYAWYHAGIDISM